MHAWRPPGIGSRPRCTDRGDSRSPSHAPTDHDSWHGPAGAAEEVTYAVQLKPQATMTELVTELNQVEGVMSAELNRLV